MKISTLYSKLHEEKKTTVSSKPRFPIQPVVTGVFFFENRLSSVFWVPWVIIRIEIKNEKRCVIV